MGAAVSGGPTESKRVEWYARADSNGRPFAPETSALTTNQSLTFTIATFDPRFPQQFPTVCYILGGYLGG
jgi:hypothetical protein